MDLTPYFFVIKSEEFIKYMNLVQVERLGNMLEESKNYSTRAAEALMRHAH